MARKKEEVVIDKKTKEKLTEEILNEINTNVKENLCKKVVEEVKETIDLEYKDELKNKITDELVIDVKNEIKKEQNKLIRRKNFKIFRLYVYILLLIAVSVFAIYKLYITGNLAVISDYEVVEKTTSTSTTQTKDFAWYLSEYGNILDNIHITNYELLKGNYKIENIDITDKLAMVYKTISTEDINVEGIIYNISEEKMVNAYKNVFGSDKGYRSANFTVDNLSFAYSNGSKAYLAIGDKLSSDETLMYKITDIKEGKDLLYVNAFVALIKDNKVYNIFDVNNTLGVLENRNIDSYLDSLSEVEFTFAKNNKKYYINAVTKK